MTDASRWQRGKNFFEDARREVEDVLRRAFAPYAEGSGSRPPAWAPHIDLLENETGFVVKADLPGIEPGDLEITIHDGVLTIQGERKEDREEKGTCYLKTERSIGRFFRDVPLPGAADEERVSATATSGVVTISIPKKPGTVPRKIPLQATC